MIQHHLLAIDIGAGQGTRVGLFNTHYEELDQEVLTLDSYGPDYPAYLAHLRDTIGILLERHPDSRASLAGAGIASAGIMNHDGSFKLAANLPLLIGRNLRADLETHLGVPTSIANDADAGALGEWSALRVEILYWVFGGGWGGAWVGQDGTVRHPTTGWDGYDESLHHSNEPGYSIALEKLVLKTLFSEVQVPYERWERVMTDDFGPHSQILAGPGGREDCVRAESILSGPGRCRLFRAVAGNDDFHERFLAPDEIRQMADPSVAGKHITKLSALQVKSAVDTDRLFGKILAHAARTLIKQAQRDGLPADVPIALGGKPSQALPWFGPSCQRLMGRMGLMNYLRPSVIAARGGNANLLGAAVLAAQHTK